MYALLIAESTPKLMKLAGFARTTVPDVHWKTITTGAFTRTVERFDPVTQEARFKTKHRQHVNRIVALATDVEVVWIATDPTPRGELLAADIADQITERYPEKQIRRLKINAMTSREFKAGYDDFCIINSKKADSMRVSRVINFLISSRVKTLSGRPGGRALIPFVQRVRSMERSGESRVVIQLASGVSFSSGFEDEARVRNALGQLSGEVPGFSVESREMYLAPPRLYGAVRLQHDGCRLLGARSIEVASQAEQLYHGGYIARDLSIDRDYVAAAHDELRAFGDVPGSITGQLVGIVPTNLRCLPSDVPKPVRPVYRLIWVNTLCSFGTSMRITCETARFMLNGIEFTAESYLPLSAGFDHSSFGLLYRRGHIGKSRTIESVRMFGSGPFEYELIESLGMEVVNPALVVKSAENLGYIGFDGQEVTVLERGAHLLSCVSEQVPQLLDPGLFNATERFLQSTYDAGELVGPWSRWADSVVSAGRKKTTAYLR